MRILRGKPGASWVALVRAVSCAGVLTLSPGMRLLAAETSQAPAAAGADDTAPAASEAGQLQEITVTAERVRENLQRVPIAVNAATGAQLQQAGVTDIQSLATLVPNVVNTGNTTNFTYIRGIGSSNASLNNEAAVATYVDGVYMASPYGQFGSFNDISRIEVLKGPQGTLFGRDTTGGVIQIITPDPSHTLSTDLQESYGNYNTIGGKGYLTGGITESVAADVAVIYEDQRDGYGTDLCPGLKDGVCSSAQSGFMHENFGVRSKWLWTPTNSTKVVFAADYDLFQAEEGLQMAPGSVDPFDHTTTYDGRYNFVGIPYSVRARQYGASLHLDQDLNDWLHFVSITSWRQLFGDELHDNSRTPDNDLYTIAENSRGTYQTQEFQLIDQKPGRVTWLLGAYYFGDVVGYDPRTQTGSLVDKADFLNIFAFQTVRSYSVYGQETTELFDKTKLELGGRYTDESVTLNGQYEDAAGQIVTSTGSTAGATTYNNRLKYVPWTYRAALDRQFTDDVMGYLSFTHGFKSGGFNLPTPQRNPYLPEQIDSYELGVKSELLDHRLRVNIAAYYYNYKDIQVVIVPGLSGQLFTNAGAAHADGIDADFAFAATRHLTLRAGFGYLHGYYTDFPDAERFTPNGVAVAIPNAAGDPLPYAPRYSGNVGLSYTVPAPIGDFILSPTVAYTSAYPFTTDSAFEINRIIMVNAQLEWDSRALQGFGVQLWGKNLANEYYYVSPVESSGGWYGVPGTPRTFGINVLEKF
jgi:iron complex outermembrane recepter protein